MPSDLAGDAPSPGYGRHKHMPEERDGTLLIHFDCISNDYRVTAEDSPGMVHFVFDQAPELGRMLGESIDRVYPDYQWSSPGDSMFRRACGWILHTNRFPEILQSPDHELILRTIRQVQERMAAEFAAGAHREHFWPDVPAAMREWARRYNLVSFSTTRSVVRQRHILRLAAAESEVRMLALRTDAPEALLQDLLSSAFFSDNNECLLIVPAHEHSLASTGRQHGIPTVLVDREWGTTPYYEPAYGMYVPNLAGFDPSVELARKD